MDSEAVTTRTSCYTESSSQWILPKQWPVKRIWYPSIEWWKLWQIYERTIISISTYPSMASDVSGLSGWLMSNSQPRAITQKWEFVNLNREQKYAPVWHQVHDRSEKLMTWNHLLSHMWPPWRSVNLIRSGNMPQYGIGCTIGQKNKCHETISHQTYSPSHPDP